MFKKKYLLNLHDEIITLELVADVNHDVGNLAAGGGWNIGLHLHGGKGGNGLTLLDLIANLDLEANDDTGHGTSDITGLGGLLPSGTGNLLALVGNRHEPSLTVDLEGNDTGTNISDLAERHKLEDNIAALGERKGNLITLHEGIEEEVGRKFTDLTVDSLEVLPVDEDIRVEGVGEDILVGNDLAVLTLEKLLSLFEVVVIKRGTGSALDGLETTGLEDLGAKGLGEATRRDTDLTAEVLDDTLREGEGIGLINNILHLKILGDHELSEVTNDLGGGGDLGDVAKDPVGLGVLLLDLGPPVGEAKLTGLEQKVGVLTTGDLVEVNIGRARELAGLEGSVHLTDVLPVVVERADVGHVEGSADVSATDVGNEGTERRLRGHTGHGIHGGIDHIGTSLGGSELRGNTGTGSVMGMDVDHSVGVLLTESADEHLGSLGGKKTGHILDGKRVSAKINELLGKIEVVVKSVLALVGVGNITGVGHGGLNKTTGSGSSLDTELHVLNVVEGIEDTEDVNTGLVGLLAELVDDVVGVVGVPNGVGATEEHLERHVGNLGTELLKTLPGALVEESHGHIEGGTAPHLQREGLGQGHVGVRSATLEVGGTHTSGKERLVSITPGGVGDHELLVLSDPLGVALGTLLKENLARTTGSGTLNLGENGAGVVSVRGGKLGGIGTELGRMAVDGEVGKVTETALETTDLSLIGLGGRGEVPPGGRNLLELRVVIDERGGDNASLELGVSEHIEDEGDVGLDTTDAALLKDALHTGDGFGEVGTTGGVLDKHGVIVGGDGKTGVANAVHTDTATGGMTVDRDGTSVRSEVLLGILSGNAALDGNTTGANVLLLETNFVESGTGSDAKLGLDNVNSGNLLSDGVLDLDTGVDLNEVGLHVSGIDQELDGTSILVVGTGGQIAGILVQLLAKLVRERPSGGHLNDLLMTSLDGAITLVKMNNVAGTITKDLDLNVTGTLNELLHKDGTVTETGQSLTGGRLEEGLDILHVANDTHSLTTATHGSLDDDGEAVLIDKGLNLIGRLESTVGTGNDGNAGLDGGLTGAGLV